MIMYTFLGKMYTRPHSCFYGLDVLKSGANLKASQTYQAQLGPLYNLSCNVEENEKPLDALFKLQHKALIYIRVPDGANNAYLLSPHEDNKTIPSSSSLSLSLFLSLSLHNTALQCWVRTIGNVHSTYFYWNLVL